ncbi:MAG: ATP-binding protein [Candidatus Omnitrophica bacterium]|nr:ATP-binding protein [Candidatus Omnitrophota bacterium]
MYSSRLLEKTLKNAVASFPAVFVGGPRRSGKTTLVRHILKKYNYVLLDELDVRSFAAEDPKGFLDKYHPPVVIDEIQNVPQLLSYIKARIERDKKPGQWIITGSQQWALMKGISETLAGRIAILHLYPFVLTEIQKNPTNQPGDTGQFLEYLTRTTSLPSHRAELGKWVLEGGYPEVVFGKDSARKLWFSSYIQTYIDRDVRGNIKEINLRDFERFVRLLAARTAQEVNASTLARDVGVTVPTIKAWLTLLEASGLIFFLMPYYKNFGKRIIKAPKCYFMDTGLVSYLVGLQDRTHMLEGPMAGALFETACVSEVYRRLSVWGDTSSLYYFRSTDGLEVDMLIERPGRCYPIEVKLSSTIDHERIRNLKKWMEVSGKKEQAGFVISTSKETGVITGNIRNIHFSLL